MTNEELTQLKSLQKQVQLLRRAAMVPVSELAERIRRHARTDSGRVLPEDAARVISAVIRHKAAISPEETEA